MKYIQLTFISHYMQMDRQTDTWTDMLKLTVQITTPCLEHVAKTYYNGQSRL